MNQFATPPAPGTNAWWRSAVVYEIYVRSFADGDGDGIGDLTGVRHHLDYLARLGVDALWFTPWYASPQADGGYDVADYRRIEPAFGDLELAEIVIAEARDRGIRTIVDVVPNHVSSEHVWFRQALAEGPGSAARSRFWFRLGSGETGEAPPTRWPSEFGGESWTRTTNPDGSPGEWYLHLFTAEQPDLNWNDPAVRAEHEDVLRFWFDRGAAGVRIDSAALIIKDPELPELPDGGAAAAHPYLDRDDIHDVYRGWRAVADSYEEPRVLIGEVWLPEPERFARYLRDDEMHTAFNFDFMVQPWDASALRASIDRTLAAHAPMRAPATWVLSNHDVTRPVTRLGRADSSFSFAAKQFGTPTDLAIGTRRARAAALLIAALPGSLYIYQGDELGLPEVENLPLDAVRDPMFERNGRTAPGRDGCRVPLPWSAGAPHAGFGPADGADPWLPQPEGWAHYAVDVQEADPGSMLTLYREMLAHRRPLRGDQLVWLTELAGLPLPPTVLAFEREEVHCLTNLGDAPVSLPADAAIIVTSDPSATVTATVPPDTTVWWKCDAGTSTAPTHEE